MEENPINVEDEYLFTLDRTQSFNIYKVISPRS